MVGSNSIKSDPLSIGPKQLDQSNWQNGEARIGRPQGIDLMATDDNDDE